jgi:hypothetical protein
MLSQAGCHRGAQGTEGEGTESEVGREGHREAVSNTGMSGNPLEKCTELSTETGTQTGTERRLFR